MDQQLCQDAIEKIDKLIFSAFRQGRCMLFEHEVYAVLTELGLRVPRHVFLKDPAAIDTKLLSAFGSDKVVLKAVSPDLAHKQSVGGVKTVHKDSDFVRYSGERLLSEIRTKTDSVEGLLLAEWIDYSPELGNEALLGFRESESFGPIISFSKGGSDAEHFARFFSPPNVILAPIDRRWAQALLASTHIQKKYLSQGKTDYVDKIVDAGLKFSALAVSFSHFFNSGSRFVLTEFEVNPYIFTPDGTFMALDGFARFVERSGPAAMPATNRRESIRPFFEPSGIAVAGVSRTDSGKPGNIIFGNLQKTGRTDIFGINARGGQVTVGGCRKQLYKSIMEIPEPVDLAVVAVPAAATLPLIRQCAEKKVRTVILISGGFSETDCNRELEQEILAIARSEGIRIMGPNCLGIVYLGEKPETGINTFFIPEEKFSIGREQRKNVAILSQSGALGLVEIENLKSAIAPKAIVSYGNQLDVDPCDLVAYFQEDPSIDVIACYIEGFKPGAGRRFFSIASGSGKPLIVYKAGRTEAGKKAAESHTASIAGEYAVARAAMKQAGVIVADTMIDHGDFIKTFTLLNNFTVAGWRVAVIANAGYEKTVAADSLGDLELADLDPETTDRLRQNLPSIASVGPLLDVTPMADDAMFERSMELVLSSPSVDCLFVSVVPHSVLIHTTDSKIEKEQENLAARIVKAVYRHRKPTVVSINVVSGADAVYNRLGKTLDSGGVPTFLTAHRAMTCLNTFIRYHLLRQSNDFGGRLA